MKFVKVKSGLAHVASASERPNMQVGRRLVSAPADGACARCRRDPAVAAHDETLGNIADPWPLFVPAQAKPMLPHAAIAA